MIVFCFFPTVQSARFPPRITLNRADFLVFFLVESKLKDAFFDCSCMLRSITLSKRGKIWAWQPDQVADSGPPIHVVSAPVNSWASVLNSKNVRVPGLKF